MATTKKQPGKKIVDTLVAGKTLADVLGPGVLGSGSGNYDQAGGPYDQSGGGTHSQGGEGGYKQSKGMTTRERLINLGNIEKIKSGKIKGNI